MANAEKLWESFDDILAHRELWDQGHYNVLRTPTSRLRAAERTPPRSHSGAEMKTIFRYRLDVTDAPFMSMPIGARVLPSPPNPRSSDYIGDFVGTVVTHGGSLVWHIFEAKE